MEGIGQKKETDYIFDKTIKCDVCGKEFKTKQVRTDAYTHYIFGYTF